MFKRKEKPYEKEYKALVETFLDFITEHPTNLNSDGLQELQRYSLCKALQLQTVEQQDGFEDLSFGLVQALKLVVNQHKLLDKPTEYRQGILEACVHAVDKVIRRVYNGR